jgi:segregation and condensation protein B
MIMIKDLEVADEIFDEPSIAEAEQEINHTQEIILQNQDSTFDAHNVSIDDDTDQVINYESQQNVGGDDLVNGEGYIKRIIEAMLMASRDTLSVKQITRLLNNEENITESQVKKIINELITDYAARGIELKELAGGYRFQICNDLSIWINRLFEERPPRYSRALLETLAIITYKQPITRAEIEDIRGVSISTNTIKTLLERKWIKIAGHKNVPGKPVLYGTTNDFLDYFNLKSLKELPDLEQIISEKKISEQLELDFAVGESNNDVSPESNIDI